MNIFNENISLGKLFNLSPEAYNDMDISDLPFSIRVTNRLYQQNIRTVEALLKVNSRFLINLNGFGRNCLNQVYSFLKKISSEEFTPKAEQKRIILTGSSFVKTHRDHIISGDFSLIESGELTIEERALLKKYKEGYEVLGQVLVDKCVHDTEHVISITKALEKFCRKVTKYTELKELAEAIPAQRKYNNCKYYILAYTFDEATRKQLTDCYSTENAPLCSIIDSIDFDDNVSTEASTKFLEWCTYNLYDQITELFDKLYSNERMKTVIMARANRLTLYDVGNLLHVTRERIRQIELKAKRLFIWHQSRLRILAKIYADQNGQSIVTQEDIGKVSGENANALIYLLKISKSSFYTYDDQLDSFVVGDTETSSRIQNFMDSLPDFIKKAELQDILDLAKEQEDLAPEFVEKAIFDSYKITGDVYHRTRLSLAKVYEEVLTAHYPNGIHVYDDRELAQLRKIIIDEYGDLGLPENNRAITARIASIGVLSGRGRYVAKRKQWISNALKNKLINYINYSESPILMIGSIFYEFEDELVKEGIDNRYFLQGVLRELVGDRFYFRRDYVSKERGFTSIYSSIIAYIKENRYPVRKEEIQAKFQGITDIVISLATSDNDILNYFGEYIHGSRLVIHEDEKSRLFDQLEMLMSDSEAHHIKDLYTMLLKNNAAPFSRNAVNGSFRAYSVLEYLFRDQFQFLRPYIAKNGVEIGRPAERLHEMIYGEEEHSISDISDFARENHLQIQSTIVYINSLNDKFMMRDINFIASITSLGVSEEITRKIEAIITGEIAGTTPIRNMTCVGRFPKITGNWSEWLIYSCLLKWSDKLDVALSSGQLRQSIPLVSLKGQMDLTHFKNLSVAPVRIKIDDMNDIDELLSGIITEDMLEDI